MVVLTAEQAKAKAVAIAERKKNVEARMQEIVSTLDSMKGSPGLSGALVDREGFPRADVDIHATRTLRQEYIRLKNDFAAIMDELQSAVHEVHAVARLSGTATEGTAKDSTEAAEQAEEAAGVSMPFAVVTAVEGDSPAHAAGLQPGDRIYAFGSLSSPGATIQQIAALLPGLENQAVEVSFIRQGEVRRTSLTPRPWQGRGLLGCAMDAIRS